MRVAFYAPMKAPDHPVPSGDRTMARALVKALGCAGHSVSQPSKFRSFLHAPDPDRQAKLGAEARREVDRIIGMWDASGPADAWFTYHNHYKAPDLLGPTIAHRFGLPYAIAEASHAAKRATAWTSWHAATEAAIRAADLHLCFTTRDRDGLLPLLKPGSAVCDLPPFLDLDDLPDQAVQTASATFRLVTLAMMRPGDKLASYGLLADALALLGDMPWHLDVIGGGLLQDDVWARFSILPRDRITWHGPMDRTAAWPQVAQADLFVWPGFGEAFGLAYLEAQAVGVPVLALDTAGVAAVVQHGITGLLVNEPSPAAYAAALRGLASDPGALARMGTAALRFAREERSLSRAALVLDQALRASLEGKNRSDA